MTEPYKNEYLLLGIALAGCYAVSKSYTGSGYASVTIYDRRLKAYYGDLVDGGIVLDKRTCSENDIIHYAFSGPMLDMGLADNTARGWGDIEECFDAKTRGSLDFVALNIYLDMWRALGAKIGKRVGDNIVWENGETEAIVPVENRWQVED